MRIFSFLFAGGTLAALVVLLPWACAQGAGRKQQQQHCPTGSRNVQKLEPMPESNGCSTMGIKVGGEEDFTACCDLHDACYQTCGVSQQKCDSDFGKCMNHLCDSLFSTNKQCRGAAQMYHMGVSMFGGGGYQDSQELACTCIPEAEVYSHYKTLFGNIYQSKPVGKTAEEASAKANSLVPDPSESEFSFQTFKNLQKLFLKLLKKYPQVIRHVGPRIGRKPPAVPPKVKQKKKVEL
jgi:secretory phospholipase A2